MQIICVSRGSLTRGKELAEHLGGKLGYPVLSREKLIEEAILAGVQVSKLETSMVKPQLFTERLARERDHYLAFCTAYLGERALDGPLIYHGRTGHLLLRGIEHVLRVRVVADEEDRIAATMRDLGLDHEKARRYLSAVEEDRRNWARSMYGVSGEEAAAYDVVVNVERMSVQNAAASLLGMCQLPEFQETPASRRALQDLALSSRARLQLARDPRTNRYSFTVSAHHGALTVTYLPHDTEAASHIGPVLEAVDGVTDVAVTMASTTILWVQESFDPGSPAFRDVVQIAQKWNAAVELVQHVVTDEPGAVEVSSLAEPVGVATGAGALAGSGAIATGRPGAAEEVTVPATVAAAVPVAGGIEEDEEGEDGEAGDEGLTATLTELAKLGLAGGARYVRGHRGSLVSTCCGGVPRSLVVIGELFLDKNPAARTRLRREVQESIAGRIRVPVVTAEELRAEYLFGRRDIVRTIGYSIVVMALYLVVFTNQVPLLEFLYVEGDMLERLLVAVAVFAFVPMVAWSYGSVARSVLKLIKME